MKTLIYLCIASFFAAICMDLRQANRLIATDDGGKPLPIPGTIEVFTRHDRIPISTHAFGNNWYCNTRKWYAIGRPAMINPNLFLRVSVTNGCEVHIGKLQNDQWEETLEIDREREKRLFEKGCWIALAGSGVRYVAPPHTNWTTVAAILGKRITENYRIISSPSGGVPPGLQDAKWVIQATLDPEPDEWPARVQSKGNSIGYWNHIGDGKYVWVSANADSGDDHIVAEKVPATHLIITNVTFFK